MSGFFQAAGVPEVAPVAFSSEQFSRDIAAASMWRAYPVGPFPLSDETTAPNGVRVCDRFDVATVQKCFRHVPRRLMPLVQSRYESTWRTRTRREANMWAWEVGERLAQGRASIAESEDEIQRTAKERADEVAGMLARAVMVSSTIVYMQLVELLGRWTIPVPKRIKLQSLCARMSDKSWWRRQLRTHIARAIEEFARDIGAVHRRAGVYASDDAHYRHQQRQRRARDFFEETDLHNLETDALVSLAEVVAGSVSNPAVRRMELMTRMRGFEEWAKSQGHVGRLYTLTAPSKFHARNHDGTENKKYDRSSPRRAQAHLSSVWARLRAMAHRSGITLYGFRIAEPHQDGTPHWHLVLFMRESDTGAIDEKFRALALEVDGEEPGAQKHRFDVEPMDPAKGSATGYISKYIAKNIDGFEVGEDFEADAPADKTVGRVRAWASTHGIRQFQQIGGPGVGVWRELRRLREVPAGLNFALAWTAAEDGDWCAFVRHMGGTAIKRADRPIHVWSMAPPGRLNRYHEAAEPRPHGLVSGKRRVVTRPHEWALRPCRGSSRTRGNNCTGHGNRRASGAAEKNYRQPPESAW